MKRKVLNITMVLCGYIFLIFKYVNTENLTITTYYPSPYGAYVSLLTTGDTYLARNSGGVGIGLVNRLSAKLDVLQNNFSQPYLLRLGRTDGINTVYDVVVTKEGRVGIGKTDPQVALDVEDEARFVSNTIWLDRRWLPNPRYRGISYQGVASITINNPYAKQPRALAIHGAGAEPNGQLAVNLDGPIIAHGAIFYNNIGVGTDNPQQAIDVVNGYVKASGFCIGTDCRNRWPVCNCSCSCYGCGQSGCTCSCRCECR